MAAMPGVPWRALAGATLLGLALWCFCSPMMRRAPGPCQLDDEVGKLLPLGGTRGGALGRRPH